MFKTEKEKTIIEFIRFQKTNSGTLSREKTNVNRGFRSGSAPTPTPPLKQASNGNSNNYYIRRPTVVFNDERGGPSEKSNGAQSRLNNKFVRSIPVFILFAFFYVKF